MKLIDTHLHLIDRRRLSYDWLRNYPQIAGDCLYPDYADEARRVGITAALLMEVDVASHQFEDETRMAAELAATVGPPLLGAVSNCRPEAPGFPEFLERQRANPFVRGFRRILHVGADGVSESHLFRQNLRRIGAAGYPFDLCVFADQLGAAVRLVDSCPDVQFVLDHCGQPPIAQGGFVPWAADLHEIARRPNVAVKLSGLIAYTDPATWTPDVLRPFVEHSIHCFGWDRVVWGSDWPICLAGGSLSTWVAVTRLLVQDCSPDERAGLFARNAARLWGLG